MQGGAPLRIPPKREQSALQNVDDPPAECADVTIGSAQNKKNVWKCGNHG